MKEKLFFSLDPKVLKYSFFLLCLTFTPPPTQQAYSGNLCFDTSGTKFHGRKRAGTTNITTTSLAEAFGCIGGVQVSKPSKKLLLFYFLTICIYFYLYM